MKRITQLKDAFQSVQSHQHVFIHGGAATPTTLLKGLVEQAPRLRGVAIHHLHTMGDPFWADPSLKESFHVSPFFIGGNMRRLAAQGEIDYIPCFLSEIPQLFRSGRLPIHVALIHVSPPDIHGFCTLGTSVDVARAAVDVAELVIAQINPRMPRVHGDGFVHVDDIDFAIEIDEAIPVEAPKPPTDVELAIARHTSSLIEDGSTLQMGIGSIPDAVLGTLHDRKHLGIHTEMWTDGALSLLQKGVVDNSMKKIHPGKTVSGFVLGSQAVYDFIHDNPSVVQLDSAYVNSPFNIARNPKVVAINSAVEIDLTGQVCSDSIGRKIISGTGGQMDFIRGASLSPGGKPIIALPSRTRQGIPRIVPTLASGAGVVTTRSHVHYVITEHGIADLYGKSLNQRAQALISIAHPEDRDRLKKEWQKKN